MRLFAHRRVPVKQVGACLPLILTDFGSLKDAFALSSPEWDKLTAG